MFFFFFVFFFCIWNFTAQSILLGNVELPVNMLNLSWAGLDLQIPSCHQYFVYIPDRDLATDCAMGPDSTQGNQISGYRRLMCFGGKQMMSCSDRVCTYSLLMIKKVLLGNKQHSIYFLFWIIWYMKMAFQYKVSSYLFKITFGKEITLFVAEVLFQLFIAFIM